jgi:hypothetical protein
VCNEAPTLRIDPALISQRVRGKHAVVRLLAHGGRCAPPAGSARSGRQPETERVMDRSAQQVRLEAKQ